MGISDYVKQAEQAERDNLGAFYLAERLDEIVQDTVNSEHPDLMGYARLLATNIQRYKDKEVAKERALWEAYTIKLKSWARNNGLKTDTMEAGLAEPNKPHYTIANND